MRVRATALILVTCKQPDNNPPETTWYRNAREGNVMNVLTQNNIQHVYERAGLDRADYVKVSEVCQNPCLMQAEGNNSLKNIRETMF